MHLSGKVTVPWKTLTSDDDSPYANLSGIETFNDGENISHIQINLPESPMNAEQHTFDIVLATPKEISSKLGDIPKRSVTVVNDIGK